MLSGNLFQFEDYGSQQTQMTTSEATAVGDIEDFLTSDLKLSDSTLNDFFSEMEMSNAQDFQTFDLLSDGDHLHNNSYIPPQQAMGNNGDLPPPSYDTLLISNQQNNHVMSGSTQMLPVNFNPYFPTENYKNPNNHYQEQHTIVKSAPLTPSPPLPMYPIGFNETNFHPTAVVHSELPDNAKNKAVGNRKMTPSKKQRSIVPAHLPKLVKKPDSVPVNFNQLQALISAVPENSNSQTVNYTNALDNTTSFGNNVPLRIVNQNSQFSSNSSDENSRHGSPFSATTNGTNVFGASSSITHSNGRVRRKSSHNAIEKRYRSSINEKILELKEIVADTDEKVQKSGVLRRTIEYIRQLQSANRRLEEENITLKKILKHLNITGTDGSSDQDSPLLDSLSNPKNVTTPPSSRSESAESPCSSSDEATSPMPKRQKRTKGKQGMVNGSRLVLCCFMLCVLITNPFDYLLNRIHGSEIDEQTELRSIITSRTLQSTNSNDDLQSSAFLSTSWRQLVAWMLNFAICLVCLVKLFVYGEPIVSEFEMQEYEVLKKKADQLMSEDLINDARMFYLKCCEKLYFSIGNSYSFFFPSITWQLTRFCVNLAFVGRWLTYWSGWSKSIDTRDYNRELNDCLLQLWKIEYERSSSSLCLLNLFLSTLNTSMHAGKKLDANHRKEIVFLSALTLKRLNGVFSLFVGYVLRWLKATDLNDVWFIDTDHLKEFLLEKDNFRFKRGKILESIREIYFDYVLYENIRENLLGESQLPTNVYITKMSDLNKFSWWQHVLQVIRSISDDRQNLDVLSSTDLLREKSRTNLTIYEMAREKHLVDDRLIKIVETIHQILLALNDDENVTQISLLKQLGGSSRLITSMIDQAQFKDDDLQLAIKTLIIDGILSLRLRLITTSIEEKLVNCEDFRHELDLYRSLNRQMKLPKQRILLFESIFRVSAGLNPLSVQTVFEGALKQQASISYESPQLDVIAAILVFCHFSPSTVFHYRNILQRAANIAVTKTNHDLQRLKHQCSSLIRQPYLTL